MKFPTMIILSIIFLSGCTVLKEMQHSELVYGLNFTKYTEKEFLFTQETYNGRYESMGIIEIVVFPEVIKGSNFPSEKNKKNYIVMKADGRDWFIENLQTDLMVEKLYKIAVELGANAVTKLQITNPEKKLGTEIISGIKISGFAIKRVDK